MDCKGLNHLADSNTVYMHTYEPVVKNLKTTAISLLATSLITLVGVVLCTKTGIPINALSITGYVLIATNLIVMAIIYFKVASKLDIMNNLNISQRCGKKTASMDLNTYTSLKQSPEIVKNTLLAISIIALAGLLIMAATPMPLNTLSVTWIGLTLMCGLSTILLAFKIHSLDRMLMFNEESNLIGIRVFREAVNEMAH